jgi:hypothetical protein
MRAKIHKDEVETEDIFLSAYCVYSGLDIMKAAVGVFTRFTFLIPEHDFECIKEEMENDNQTIFAKSFIASMRKVFAVQTLARRSSGEYVSQNWRDVIRQRAEKR